jgi:hypothetical protein
MPLPIQARRSVVPSVLGKGGDPFWTSVTLLCHFDGGINGTTFVDSGPLKHPLAASGIVQTRNVQRQFGQTAGFFSGNGYIDVANPGSAFAFGTGDYTVEFRFLTTSLAAQNSLFDSRPTSTNGARLYVAVKTNGTLFTFINGGDRNLSPAGAVVVNRWYHAAVCRVRGITRLFLDGLPVGTPYIDATNYVQATTRQGRIGAAGFFAAGGEFLNGYMDEFRCTKAGRYAVPFAVQDAEYPDF